MRYTTTRIVRLSDGVEPYPGAIGTPLLLSQGGGEAYFVPSEDTRWGPGVWFLHAESTGHVSPDGKYVQVRLVIEEDRGLFA